MVNVPIDQKCPWTKPIQRACFSLSSILGISDNIHSMCLLRSCDSITEKFRSWSEPLNSWFNRLLYRLRNFFILFPRCSKSDTVWFYQKNPHDGTIAVSLLPFHFGNSTSMEGMRPYKCCWRQPNTWLCRSFWFGLGVGSNFQWTCEHHATETIGGVCVLLS